MFLDFVLTASALVGQGLGYSKLYLYHVILILGSKAFFSRFKIGVSKSWPAFILLIFSFVSILWSSHQKMGLAEVGQIALGVWFLIFRPKMKYLTKALVSVMWVNLLISLCESFYLFRYPFSMFSPMVEAIGREAPYLLDVDIDRPTGFSWNPNNNAFLILIFSPIVLKYQKVLVNILYYGLSSFVIYKASSKLILLGWIILTLMIVCTYMKRMVKYKALVLSMVGLIGLIVLADQREELSRKRIKYSNLWPSLYTSVSVVPHIIYKRFTGQEVTFNYFELDASLHDRLLLVDGLLLIISKHVWFGVGAGGLSKIEHSQWQRKLPLSSPHFYFLEVWAKYGLLYLLFYFSWLFYLLNKLRKAKNYEGLISLVFFIIFNPVLSSVSYFLPKWVLYRYADEDSD